MLKWAVILTFWISTVSGQGTATIMQSQDRTVCPITHVNFTCLATNTGNIRWQDINGNVVQFTNGNSQGENGAAGMLFAELLNVDGNNLMATATILEQFVLSSSIPTLLCSNGLRYDPGSVSIAGRPSRLLVSVDPCDYEDGLLTLKWSPPNDTPNCCVRYVAEVHGMPTVITTQTSITLDRSNIPEAGMNATIYCQDKEMRNGSGVTIPIFNQVADPFVRHVRNESLVVINIAIPNRPSECRPSSVVSNVLCIYDNGSIINATKLSMNEYTCESADSLKSYSVILKNEDGSTSQKNYSIIDRTKTDILIGPVIGSGTSAVFFFCTTILFLILTMVFAFLWKRDKRDDCKPPEGDSIQMQDK